MQFETVSHKKQKFSEKGFDINNKNNGDDDDDDDYDDYRNRDIKNNSSLIENDNENNEENYEDQEIKTLEKNPRNRINLNKIHEIILNRNNHNKNNLFHIEKIANPQQINNFFLVTQFSEATLLIQPNKPILNNTFVTMKLLFFFDKEENIVNYESITNIPKSKILLKKKIYFALELGSQETHTFEVNKRKVITRKSSVYKYSKYSDKKKRTINISNYSLYYALFTYYESSNKEQLLSQLNFEKVKRENYLLNKEQNSQQLIAQELNPNPDTITVFLQGVWMN